MNKLLTMIAKGLIGLSMAVGVGVAIGTGSKASRADAAPTSVTYAQSSTTAASVTSGSAFSGTTVTFATSYTNNKNQLTNGNSQTWTFSGYSGCTISNITASVKNNASSGAGSATLKNNGATVTLTKSSFSGLGSAYVSQTLLSGSFTCSGDIVLTFSCSANSFYIESVSFDWESSSSGSSESFTIVQSTITGLSGSYDSGAEKAFTIAGVGFGVKAAMKNSTNIQFQASNGRIYNTTAFDSGIESITLTQTGSVAWSLYCGTSSRLVNSTAANYTVTGGTTTGITNPSTGTSMTWTISNLYDYTFFCLSKGSSAGYVSSIMIQLKASSGDSTPLTTPNPSYNQNNNRIEWTADQDADHYEISFDEGDNWTTTTASTYHDVSSLASSAAYTALVKAIADENDSAHSDSSIGTVLFAKLSHAGTNVDPYTVSDARAAITASTGITGVYATGVVSAIVSEYSSQYGNVTFDFVDVGGTDALRAYHCGGTDADKVDVGDTVVVSGNLTLYGSIYEFDTNTTLVSLIHPTKDYTITFDSDGGTDPDDITRDADETFRFPSAGTKTGYVFKGWSNDSGTTVYAEGSYFTVTGDDDFVAIWQTQGNSTNPYSVAQARAAIDSGLGVKNVYVTGIVSYFVTQYDSENDYISFDFIDNGGSNTLRAFRCVGSDIADVEVNDTVVVSGNLTLYIQGDNSIYELESGCVLESVSHSSITYTITYDSNGGTGSMEATVATQPQVAACTFTAPSGYDFSRWNDEEDGTGNDYAVGSTVSEDITLYAIWEQHVVSPTDFFTQITSASDISDGKYVIAYGDVIFDGSQETLDAASNGVPMTLANLLTSYFTISDGSVRSASGYYIGKTAYSNGLDSKTTDDFENEISFDQNGNLIITAEGGCTLRYNSASDQLRFRFYKSGQKDIQLYKVNFAEVLLTGITCNAQGTSQPTGESWSNLEQYYSTLSTSEKALLLGTTASESGTDVQKAMAKYDYIVGKYLKGQGLSTYKDFIGRDPQQIGGQRLLLNTIMGNNTNTVTLIVIVSMVSVTAIGGYFFIRRRKVN